jgi:deazaflavin-dependent oxidoreductase (nitroreductase family)
LTSRQRLKRRANMVFWRLFNPPARLLAGYAPWWVVLETIGRRSGEPRRVPLARGPVEGSTAWLIAVHGENATFVRNIAANRSVRLKLDRRWRDGTAELVPFDREIFRRFSAYVRLGVRSVEIEPKLIRVAMSGESADGE